MKRDFGRKIRSLMNEKGIVTAKDLADKINEAAGEKIITASSIGRWLSGQSEPKSTSLMFLAKTLKISADLILSDEGLNPESTKSLERMVSAIVKAEFEKAPKISVDQLNEKVCRFMESKKIPKEDKDSILRQIENLLKMYPNGEN